MANKRFSIEYFKDRQGSIKLERWHERPHLAFLWCQRRGIDPRSVLIQEFDEKERLMAFTSLANFLREGNEHTTDLTKIV